MKKPRSNVVQFPVKDRIGQVLEAMLRNPPREVVNVELGKEGREVGSEV